MHEFGRAQVIISTALNFAAEKKAKKVDKGFVETEKLHDHDREEILFAFKQLSKGTILENSELQIDEKEIEKGKHCLVTRMEMD